MRISLMKMALIAVLVGAFAVAATASASADTTSCTNTGTVKLSPGLAANPVVQNITITGTLTGCSGEGSTVTGGKYVAHLKTTEGADISALPGPGAPTEGTIVIKWSPRGGGTSKGTFSMPLTEAVPVSLGGTIGNGPFDEDLISGSVTQVYPPPPPPRRHGKVAKIKKGTVSGALTINDA
jgi:hypothetical protein